MKPPAAIHALALAGVTSLFACGSGSSSSPDGGSKGSASGASSSGTQAGSSGSGSATSGSGAASGASTSGAPSSGGSSGSTSESDAASSADAGNVSEAGGVDGPSTGTTASHVKTIFLILMENHNWSDIKGSSSAPFINGTLLPTASSCSNYYDNPSAVHPSEPNYIWLEAGDNLGITNDSDPSVNHQAATSHLVTLLTNAGVTWTSYQEDIADTGCPITSVNKYAPKHNPMVFFDDVVQNPPSATSSYCSAHMKPFSKLAGDLGAGTVAQYNFITPNLCDDMHDTCTGDAIRQGDDWLKANVPVIQASQAYKTGAIFITWDESEGGEFPIGMIVLSPFAKGGGYIGATKYYHSSMLRSAQEILGVTPLLRDAANQPDLSDLFTTFP